MDNMIFTSEVCGVVLIAPFDKISRPPCSTIRFIVFLSLFFRCFSPFSFYHRTFSLTTPSKTWVQTCGFTFEFLAGSPLGEPAPTKPRLDAGGASAGFDWEQFFHDIGIQNADDWLTIAIIAVLNILPRIFMFAFIILMGLSLIANVKPWQAFCDSVFDPYKLLTFGRQDVHTIKLKMVILYSIIALALFGLFQNGIILEVIAWVARAVTGILSR